MLVVVVVSFVVVEGMVVDSVVGILKMHRGVKWMNFVH